MIAIIDLIMMQSVASRILFFFVNSEKIIVGVIVLEKGVYTGRLHFWSGSDIG